MKKLKEKDIDNLTPDQVQKELLKIALGNNKKLYSINYTLNFFGLVVVIGIFITIAGLLF